MTRYERTPYEACPLCTCADVRTHRTGDCSRHALFREGFAPTIDWLRCQECQHVFASGFFEGDALDALFSKTQEFQQPGYQLEQQRYVSADIIERVVAATGKRSGRWLDVGFGAGNLLATAAEYGFDVVGCDLRDDSVNALAALGLDVHCLAFGTLEGESFDIISMADVLEHMPFPRQDLRVAQRMLAPGGVLFISCPNDECFVWRVLDTAGRNPYWGEIEHLHNFGKSRLERLLLDVGLTPAAYSVSRRYRACMEIVALKN